jgi:hypothetical protein
MAYDGLHLYLTSLSRASPPLRSSVIMITLTEIFMVCGIWYMVHTVFYLIVCGALEISYVRAYAGSIILVVLLWEHLVVYLGFHKQRDRCVLEGQPEVDCCKICEEWGIRYTRTEGGEGTELPHAQEMLRDNSAADATLGHRHDDGRKR